MKWMPAAQLMRYAGGGLLCLLAALLLPCAPPTPQVPKPDPFAGSLFRVGFGSCNFQFRPQPHWARILARKPHLWIWGGDAIYADTKDPDRIKGAYTQQLEHTDYRGFRSRIPIIGVWDDHDYGFNDVGKGYPHKAQSQLHFLDFIGEPKDSPRRKQQGIYASYLYSPGPWKLRVILLDVRYHREEAGGDMLGRAQWRWLEKQLEQSQADIHFLVSPTQVLRDDLRKSTWAQYPASRERLFGLLKKHQTPGVLLLTGDIHVGEISRSPETAVAYPIYEFTSSGLTHTETDFRLANRHRLSLLKERNFGMIDVLLERGAPVLHLQLYDLSGALRVHRKVPLSALQIP